MMIKHCLHILLFAALLLATCTGCEKQEEFANNPEGNFDALWTTLDQHYSFFAYKHIDWEAVGRSYRAKVRPEMTSSELFDLCSAMLMELHDGHTNLISAANVSRYWIWEKRPLNYDERLIDQYYLNFDYKRASGMKYQILSNNFGYLYYGDFGTAIGEGNLDAALEYLASSDGLVIDVRSNGGGYLTNVKRLVGRFINEKIYAGAISHKKGPRRFLQALRLLHQPHSQAHTLHQAHCGACQPRLLQRHQQFCVNHEVAAKRESGGRHHRRRQRTPIHQRVAKWLDSAILRLPHNRPRRPAHRARRGARRAG